MTKKGADLTTFGQEKKGADLTKKKVQIWLIAPLLYVYSNILLLTNMRMCFWGGGSANSINWVRTVFIMDGQISRDIISKRILLKESESHYKKEFFIGWASSYSALVGC